MEAEWDILHQRGGGLDRISDRQPAYDPMHFLYCSHMVNHVGI